MAHISIGWRPATSIARRAARLGELVTPSRRTPISRALLLSALLLSSLALSPPSRAQDDPSAAFVTDCTKNLQSTWWSTNVEFLDLPTIALIFPSYDAAHDGYLVDWLEDQTCNALYQRDFSSVSTPTGFAVVAFNAYIAGLGYGDADRGFAEGLFTACFQRVFHPALGFSAATAVDAIRGCSNAAETTVGLAWAEHVATSIGTELLMSGFPPIESVHVDALVKKCLQQHVTAADRNTLSDIRKNCAVAVPLQIINGNDAVDVPMPTLNGDDAAAVKTALAGCLGANAPVPVVTAYQPQEDPATAACPCDCPAPSTNVSPSAVAPVPTALPPAPAPPPAVVPQSPGKLWNVKVQAASGSTSTWIATWTLRPGTSNEFDVKQTRFDGAVTTYHLRVTVGTDSKVKAEAFGDMQGPSSCDQLTLAGTLVGNAVSDGTYTCVGYKGTWQATVEGR